LGIGRGGEGGLWRVLTILKMIDLKIFRGLFFVQEQFLYGGGTLPKIVINIARTYKKL